MIFFSIIYLLLFSLHSDHSLPPSLQILPPLLPPSTSSSEKPPPWAPPQPWDICLNKTRHIFSHWGPARQPGRGRGSNTTEKSQRQPVLYLLGDPWGDQAAHLLQMCRGLGLAPICSLVAGPVSAIPRMIFFKALGAPTMCRGLVPVSKVMIYVCQWNSRFPKIIHWHSYSK